MATADELLATSEPVNKTLTIDLEKRIIVIPASVSLLGVESDDEVHRLQFKIPRHYGEIDLSEFKFHINYENAKHGGDMYDVEELIVDSDFITFSWLVDRFAFLYKGDVTFNICMKKYDAGKVVKELNTTPATLPVLEGLETDKAVINAEPGALDRVLMRLYAIEAASGLGTDSYYNVVRVEEDNDGAVFTVVNKDGTTEAYIRHGIDGYTPVVGKDYYTDGEKIALKTELTGYLKDYVDVWSPKKETVTLLASSWVGNKQTVIINGVNPENSIEVVAPEPSSSNYANYVDAGIRCVGEAINELTFQCDSVPSENIAVNIVVYYSNDEATGNPGITVTDDDAGNVTIM